jgi:hypothetical protein
MEKFSDIQIITGYGELEFMTHIKLSSEEDNIRVNKLKEIITIAGEYKGSVSLLEDYVFCIFPEHELATLFKMTWELDHD